MNDQQSKSRETTDAGGHGQTGAHGPAPPNSTAHIPPFEEKWLESFYRECGREVTLAYTTLNQMKNWAMIVVAAAISGLAFGSSAEKYPSVPMLIGAVVVYTFTLRFFIRAILCYTNLLRWNTLQNDCIKLKLVTPRNSDIAKQAAEKLLTDVERYYHEWLSPISRKRQWTHVLKLGFALILALPIFFVISGVASLFDNHLVQGLVVFAVGDTVVELNDYFKSRYFDDWNAHEQRPTRSKLRKTFPIPASNDWFVVSWLLVLAISVFVAVRSRIFPWFLSHIQCVWQGP